MQRKASVFERNGFFSYFCGYTCVFLFIPIIIYLLLFMKYSLSVVLVCCLSFFFVLLPVPLCAQQAVQEQVNSALIRGTYSDALSVYRHVSKMLSSNKLTDVQKAELHVYAGRLSLRMSRFAQADDHFQNATRLASGEDLWVRHLHLAGVMGHNEVLREREDWEKWFANILNEVNEMKDIVDICSKYVQEGQAKGQAYNTHPEFAAHVNSVLIISVLMCKDLGNMYLWQQDYKEGMAHYEEALSTYTKYQMSLVPHLIDILIRRGEILFVTGRYEEALNKYAECRQLVEIICGKGSFYEAVLQTKLGEVYAVLGDAFEANACLERAMAIFEKNGDKETKEYAYTLFQWGKLKLDDQPQIAIGLFEEARRVQNVLFGEGHVSKFRSTIFLVEALSKTGERERADELYQTLLDKTDGFIYNPSDLLLFIRSGAEFWIEEEGYKETAELLDEGMDILNENLVKDPVVLRSFLNLGGYLHLMDEDYIAAIPYFERQMELERQQAHDIFAFLPEGKRTAYWKEVEKSMDRLFLSNREGVVVVSGGRVVEMPAQNSSRSARLLYDASLLNKGIMLEASANLLRLINQSGNDDLLQLYQQLKRNRQELAATRQFKVSEEWERKKSEADALEQQIIVGSREIGDYMNFTAVTWKDVKAALKPGETALEFVCSRDKEMEYYSAELVRADYDEPKHFFLMALPVEHKSDCHPAGELTAQLTQKIWKKLLPHFTKGKRVYFSPSGRLYNIPVEYLPFDDERRMDDVYRMVRLSSTRELVLHRSANGNRNAVLYGGLNYNTGVDDMELYAASFASTRGMSKRGFVAPDGTQRNLWGYLSGTLREVDDIESELVQKCYQVMKYTGDTGVEESLKALSGQPFRILHLATHGYYLPKEGKTVSSFAASAQESLNRSGLVFSGANNAWLNPSSQLQGLDDGILTAHEISLLNFAGTDLVTLSACQTGLGDVTSEGVFGLQRAFKLAGVHTLLMSLWQVSDEATQAMMSEFYRGLAAGLDKRSAFAAAQAKVRRSVFMIDGKAVPGSDPALWAAFVMMD
ncbi:MAG: CHAT domain-containing protein [Alistipes sp.]|nr:CHAT domain-containing protein [Alistipes sp.]